MANPITGTTATDRDPVLPLPPPEVFTFVNRETDNVLTATVHTAQTAVLYVCERDTLGALGRGTSIVITRGIRHGLPVGVVYRDMPRALRGEGYAQLYYEGEVPVLKMAHEDALWALEMVHVSDDLLDPEQTRRRTDALGRIISLLEERSGPRVKRALSNAVRALEREDVQERPNPMAAAMANWGLTVQLDHRFHEAVQIQERVSRSRHAILQNLLSTWGIFQAIKIEMEAMRRWWRLREDPLDKARALPLAHRVGRLKQQLDATLLAAPYCNIVAVSNLSRALEQLEEVLRGPESNYGNGARFHALAWQWASFLRLHAELVKFMDPVARARRQDRDLVPAERVVFMRSRERLVNSFRQLIHAAHPPSLDRRCTRATALLTQMSSMAVPSSAYEQIDLAMRAYLD